MARLAVETSHSGAFVRFWIADAVSNLGTFVSTLALQLLLIETLHADQTALGVVRAAQWLPYLLFGMLAGVVVDRVRRRPLLVAADVLCAVLLGAVGVLALTGHLTVPVLAVLVFCAGSASMFFSAAHLSLLPTIVPGPGLASANARLSQTYAATQSLGPLVGGALVQAPLGPGGGPRRRDVVCRVGPRADDRPCRGAASRAGCRAAPLDRAA